MQLEAALRLLERLPEGERTRFLNRYLREAPALDSARFAHDRLAAVQLRALLSHGTGLTWIQSRSEDLRSYVFCALAHEASRAGNASRELVGVDLLSAEAYVPVHGLLYPRPGQPGQSVQQQIRQLLKTARAWQLLWLNGVWCRFPELQNEILSAAAHSNVIVADQVALNLWDAKVPAAARNLSIRRILVSESSGRIAIGVYVRG